MRARQLIAAVVLLSIAGAASAAPKTYLLTGKLTSNRGTLINLPMVGNVGCGGAGLSNLTVMSGPGPKVFPAPYDPPPLMTMIANNYGCVAHKAGKKITTTGAGVGGAFVMPTMVFEKATPPSGAIHIPNATPVKQLYTNFRITGPRSAKVVTLPPGSMAYLHPPAAFHAFKKGAWATQTGRQGSMFTWCWGNPDCAQIAQGTKPLIVKYSGGGNAFGGTMAFVVSSDPASPSNIGVAAGGGVIGFGILPSMGSQPSGGGYAVNVANVGPKGPIWGMYQSMSGHITMVSLYLGMNFPNVTNSNYGFPFTTMTVLARNTGTFAGNPKTTTLTAKGGDTVTAMGKRNISLVAGGVARSNVGTVTPTATNNTGVAEIAQMYLPEPGSAASLAAGALALLAIAAARKKA
jgi:hypothetical protein